MNDTAATYNKIINIVLFPLNEVFEIWLYLLKSMSFPPLFYI